MLLILISKSIIASREEKAMLWLVIYSCICACVRHYRSSKHLYVAYHYFSHFMSLFQTMLFVKILP